MIQIQEDKLKKLYKIAYLYQIGRQGGICGQAFTHFTCIKCDLECSHPNTNTPILCDNCHKEIRAECTKERNEKDPS